MMYDMDPGLSGENVLQKMFHRSVLYSFSGFFTVMLNTAVDGMIIGHFMGMKAMAAFGLIVPLYSLINLIPVLLRTASQLNIGMDLGRGKLETARRRVFRMLMTGLAASVPFLLLFTVFRGTAVSVLCAFTAHADDTISMAEEYLLWMAPAMPSIMVCPVLHPVMQLDGDARRSPFAIHVATVVNILGDILNVMIFHQGMAGMAAASVLSCYAELLVLLLHYRSKTSLLRPYPCMGFQKEWVLALSNGIPVMLHEFTAFLTGIVINHFAFQLAGEDLVAAVAAGNSIWAFLLPGCLAVSGAVATLGGVSRGEADHKGVRTVLLMGLWYALIPCSIYALIFIASAGPAAHFFSGGNDQLFHMSLAVIRGFAVSLPLVAVCQVVERYLIVVERKLLSAVIGILEGGVCWIVFVRILDRSEPVSRIWMGHLFGELALVLIIAACFMVYLLRTGNIRNVSGKHIYSVTGDEGESQYVLEATVSNFKEATAFSESLRIFCSDHNISSRLSMLAALCEEEVACNTLQWGYSKGSDGAVDVRAVCENKAVILRFRDSGRHFDPESYISRVLITDKDPARNMGLRIISGIASEMQYMCIVDCNVLILRVE